MLFLIHRLACRQRDNLYRRPLLFLFSFLISASFSPLSITLRLLGTDSAWAFLALHSIWLGKTPFLLSKVYHSVWVLGFQFGSSVLCLFYVYSALPLSLLKFVVSQIYPFPSPPSPPLAVSFLTKKKPPLIFGTILLGTVVSGNTVLRVVCCRIVHPDVRFALIEHLAVLGWGKTINDCLIVLRKG